MNNTLRQEFDDFHRFCTVPFFGAQSPPISAVTARKYADHMRCARARGRPAAAQLQCNRWAPFAECCCDTH